jgi:hypothetical protein
VAERVGRGAYVLTLGLVLAFALDARAATVWTGPPIEFAKAAFADPTNPANQDAIIPGVVAITRGSSQGIYNAAVESSYGTGSPADTEWAYANNNPGKTISAVNYANLQFDPWVVAVNQRPPNVVGLPAVVHIISADIYFDLTMLQWGVTPGAGGSFRYRRSTAPPIPTLSAPWAAALAAALVWALVRGR